jgi:aspartyl-tRNA(Asn)/glutamyl-tRNA(Gln) amidotransferase subunit A
MTDLAFASAAELASMIRNREISPVEVMQATLSRIEQSQPILNSFITVAAEPAMEAATAAEAAVMHGAALGPLHGVPVAVKDLVPTAGIRTTSGSLIFKDHVPSADAEVVTRLKRAGAIVVGKTTTPEFGQQCLTEAPLFGSTRNAWAADRSSGGSSGGSAVAVAAGLVPIAVATDGGGSTRIPAACTAS